MIETHLNIFDAVIIGVMLLSCIFAFYRGFVKEVLSLGAWVGAGIVTIYYFPVMAEKLHPHFKNPVVAAGLGTLVIYVCALILFSMINMLIIKYIKSGNDVGVIDNMFGLVYGVARGMLIISLGYFLLTIAMPEKEYPRWLKESMTRPVVEQGALALARVAPNYLREISTLERSATAEIEPQSKEWQNDVKAAQDKAEAAQEQAKKNSGDVGYSPSVASQIQKLIAGSDDKK